MFDPIYSGTGVLILALVNFAAPVAFVVFIYKSGWGFEI